MSSICSTKISDDKFCYNNYVDDEQLLISVCLGFLARSVSSKSASLVNHPATHFFSHKNRWQTESHDMHVI